MTAILGFLTSRIGGPVMGALAVVLLCLLIATGLKVGALKLEVAGKDRALGQLHRDIDGYDLGGKHFPGLKDNLAQCRANREMLEGSLAAQNAAVGRLKAESDRRAVAAEKAVRDARAVAQSHALRAASLAAARPQSCADVSNLIDGAAR